MEIGTRQIWQLRFRFRELLATFVTAIPNNRRKISTTSIEYPEQVSVTKLEVPYLETDPVTP